MIRTLVRHSLQFLALSLALVGLAQADNASQEEAKKMVEAAVAHVKAVGPDKAFADFSTPGGKWHDRDLYLFCYRLDGTNTCHGANKALIGKNLIDLKTADGQQLIRNMVDISKSKGSGWIEYKWPHPQSKQIEEKKAFVLVIPGYDGFIGAGIYR